MTNNKYVLSWIEEMAAMTNPDKIVWIDGTEEQAEAKDWNFCRAEENCPYCKGLGEVHRDARGELHPMI